MIGWQGIVLRLQVELFVYLLLWFKTTTELRMLHPFPSYVSWVPATRSTEVQSRAEAPLASCSPSEDSVTFSASA